MRWLVVATFLLVAVVLTGSRGGFAGALVSLVIFVTIWLVKFRQLRSFSAPILLVSATVLHRRYHDLCERRNFRPS